MNYSISQAKLLIEDVLAMRGHDRYYLSQFLWYLAGFGYAKFEAITNAEPDPVGNLEQMFLAWKEKEIEKETEWRHVLEGML